jgi:hypothetical protein
MLASPKFDGDPDLCKVKYQFVLSSHMDITIMVTFPGFVCGLYFANALDMQLANSISP